MLSQRVLPVLLLPWISTVWHEVLAIPKGHALTIYSTLNAPAQEMSSDEAEIPLLSNWNFTGPHDDPKWYCSQDKPLKP